MRALEDAFCEYFNIKHAIAMNSATSCLHAACIACDLGDSEVIVSPYTFSASVSCVVMAGAYPKFVDIDPDTFCITPDERDIESDTSAIIPVHLCGHPSDMDSIMKLAHKYNLKVIEDASQAIGAKYKGRYVGTIGDCGIFSFNQSKHVSTGEGGILITNNDAIARIARAVRNHAEVADPELAMVGYNYRLGEIEAILALDQFKDLDIRTARRIHLTDYLSEKLSEIDGFTPPVTKADCRHVFYTYAVKYDESKVGIPRDEFQDRMIEKGVYFGKNYVKPLYRLPAFRGSELPVVERMWKELIVTDICRYPATTNDMQEVIDTIKDVICG